MPIAAAKNICRRAVRSQSVGHNFFDMRALMFDQLPHKSLCRGGISSFLNQHIEHDAFIIDRAPQIHSLTGDLYDHLIEMPAVRRSRSRASQVPREIFAELQGPATDRFVADIDSALGQEVFHVTETKREAEIRKEFCPQFTALSATIFRPLASG